MAKKVIIAPQLIVLPDTPGTNAVTAAVGDYEILTPKLAGFNLEDSATEVEVTTSEDVGFKSYIAGLRDFTATLMFKGGDTAEDYAKIAAFHRLQSLFVIIQGHGATAAARTTLSAENGAWVFTGRTFTLPIAGELDVAQDFDVTVRPSGGGGARYVIDASEITGVYTNCPIT